MIYLLREDEEVYCAEARTLAYIRSVTKGLAETVERAQCGRCHTLATQMARCRASQQIEIFCSPNCRLTVVYPKLGVNVSDMGAHSV